MGQDLTKLTPDELKARQIKEMDAEMKHKLQRGANYNMKVVIKGDKNTGKTCLWRRLQRMAFLEDYRSTEQIQIATIAWDYKATSDKIKVEVWDVVDKASKRKESGNLKLGIQGEDGLDVDLSDDEDERKTMPNLPVTTPGVNPQGSFSVDKLDAETVDVYKNCHAVLFLMDPRKKWTFDYIERELPNVPKNTFVLILVNYKDVPQNQRVITEYELQEFARGAGKFVRCLECSMRNCYGMKGIRCFFNLPFLKLKRQYIIQQLKENEADLDAADQELELVNSEQNYDFYLKWLEENRKNMKATAQMTSVLPEGPPPRASIESSKNTEMTAASLSENPKLGRNRSTSTPQGPATSGSATPTRQPPAPVANTAASSAARPAQPPQQPTTPQRPPPAAPQAHPPAAPPAKPPAPAEGGLMSWTSKLFTSSTPAKPAAPAAAPKREVRDVVADLQKLAKNPEARGAQNPTSVEDFVPPTEGGDDFWGGDDDDDDDDGNDKANAGDSDDDDGRSLIAKDEDLDDDDDDDDDDAKVSPAAAKEKLKREREERERKEREREQRERELKEKERQRKEKEDRERRERERAQAEALRRQFEQQEAAAAAAAKPAGGEPARSEYDQVSDDDDGGSETKPVASNDNNEKKNKEKSIWGTNKDDDSDDDDDDDDDDNEAWGLPPKKKKDGQATPAKTPKKKSNPFIVTNDEDLPSDDDEAPKAKQPVSSNKAISASMGSIPTSVASAGESSPAGGRERRREDKERRKRRDGSYGDLAEATGSTAAASPEGAERKERKSRHRHRDREGSPEGADRKERKSRHRHRDRSEGSGGDNNGTPSGSGERESRRSSRSGGGSSSKRSHHRSRSASPTPQP